MPPDGPWLVVGLGNPGPSYAGHRHNAGFMVLDVLGDRLGGRFRAHRSHAEVLEAHSDGVRLVCAKPRTYMNLSGSVVAGLAGYFRVAPARIVVVHDELDIPYGTLRLKQGGGDGGHNGLRSVTKSLGTPDYVRVRVGIGRPPGRTDPADFVLSPFTAAERKELGLVVAEAADAVVAIVHKGLAAAQAAHN